MSDRSAFGTAAVNVQVAVILVAVLAVIISDFLFLAELIPGGRRPPGLNSDTYSAFTRYVSEFSPVMPWVWGLFGGRFIHFGREPLFREGRRWIGWLILALSTLFVSLVWGLLAGPVLWQPIDDHGGMTVVFLLGWVAGFLFWPAPDVRVDFSHHFRRRGGH